MRVFCSLIACVDESSYGGFQALLGPILQAASDPIAMHPNSESVTKEVLEILAELIGFAPRFFKPAVGEYARFMVSLAGAPEALGR